jgi:hypothetical protein
MLISWIGGTKADKYAGLLTKRQQLTLFLLSDVRIARGGMLGPVGHKVRVHAVSI